MAVRKIGDRIRSGLQHLPGAAWQCGSPGRQIVQRALTGRWSGAIALHTAAQVCSGLAWVLVARSLAVEELGKLGFCLSAQSYLVMLGSAGLKTVVMREAATQPGRVAALNTAHLLMTGMLGTFVLGAADAAVLSLDSIRGPERAMWLVLSVGAWFSIVNVTPFVDAQRRQRTSLTITFALEALGVVLLLISPARPLWVASIFSGKWCLQSIGHWAVLIPTLPVPRWQWDPSIVRKLGLAGWPLAVTGMLSTVPFAGAVVVTRVACGAESAAATAVANQVCMAYLALMGIVYRLLQPELTSGLSFVDQRARERVRNAVLAGLLFWLAALGGTLFVVYTVLPGDFRAEIAVMFLQLAAGLGGGLSYLCWACLLAFHAERWVLVGYGLGSATFAAGAAYGARAESPLLIAAAAAAGMLVAAAVMFLRTRQLVRFRSTGGRRQIEQSQDLQRCDS